MSFDFLPAPIYIIGALTLSGSLVFYIFTDNIPDKKSIRIGTFFFAITGLGLAIVKTIEVYLVTYKQYIGYIQIVSGAIAVIGFVLMMAGGWKDAMNDPRRRKLLLTSIIMLIVIIILTVLLIIAYLIFEK